MSIPSFGYTCRKHFDRYPCCHRQWKHPGHCRFVHGYSRSFTFWFAARELDVYGFVVDFSSLKPLEQKLRNQFDHTFLINADDPLLLEWRKLHEEGALDLRVMENVGMEASAQLVWGWANSLLFDRDAGRTCCWQVEASEDDINSASYEAIPSWFQSENPLITET
ncbi:6-carboxytetrahydropterin synthase [Prochlorococcus sp. MIT 1300]|uniref:6-carboxytetrahydropterin synthase n=1 Tax=Prochlorococcus sp. MIT 1300 TaxID=3096218 RepID=UPI002A7620B8|nr:6-carboxytetrahydropterin synthase [Prochlorococcus sp. MIT 1300]